MSIWRRSPPENPLGPREHPTRYTWCAPTGGTTSAVPTGGGRCTGRRPRCSPTGCGRHRTSEAIGFAGNMLVLPHGAYFGRVEPEEASRAHRARSSLAGSELDLYRGRSTMHRIAQAADHFVRDPLRMDGIDDVEVVGFTSALRRDPAEVSAHGPAGEKIAVRVEYRSAPESRCSPAGPRTPPGRLSSRPCRSPELRQAGITSTTAL